jgi:hypothetical protein
MDSLSRKFTPLGWRAQCKTCLKYIFIQPRELKDHAKECQP